MSCFKIVRSCVPVLLIMIIMFWSYYAYVFQLCFYTIRNTAKRTAYLIFYHIFFLLFMFTYFNIVCSRIGTVPQKYKFSEAVFEELRTATTDRARQNIVESFCRNRHLAVNMRTPEGYIRICSQCQLVKPDRTHHCSTCEKCVLKMDHHCPWVRSCIGFSNYKLFTLLLLHIAFYCTFYVATSMEYFIIFFLEVVEVFDYKEIHIIAGFLLAASIGMTVASFFWYHMSLILKNETTLEHLREPDFTSKDGNPTFNVGKCNNFMQVFGDSCCLWFFPINNSLGNGVNFPIRVET